MHIHSDSHRHHLICLEKKKKGINRIRTKGWVNPNTNAKETEKERAWEIGGFEFNSNYVLSVNLNVKVKEWFGSVVLGGTEIEVGVECEYY